MFSVLYVDDEPDLLEICQLFLESTGDFTVSTVESGDKALATLARVEFDAVISDYQMPGLTGIELLKEVRKSDPDIPFILFTGRGREEVVIEAINNGADFYLQKGGDPRSQFAELAHKLRQAIGRRQAEKALSDSQKRLADLIDFLPDATFAIDTEGNVIAWNHAIEEMTGIAAREMLGKGDYEYALPFYGARRPILIDLIFEPDEKVTEYYSNLHREGNILSAETDLPHPKGTRIYVLAKASPLYTRKGDIAGAIESIRDITDRKRAEEELRALNEQLTASDEELRSQLEELVWAQQAKAKSEADFRLLVDNAPDAIYIQTNNRFRYLNHAARTLFGAASDQDLIGTDIFDRIHPAFHDRIRERVRDLTFNLQPVSLLEEVYVKLDGTPLDVEVRAVPLDYEGEHGALVIVHDISVRKRAALDLQAAYEQLATAEEELRSQYNDLAENERRIRASEARLRYMLGFYDRAAVNQQELMDSAVEGAGVVTDSPFGYLAFLNDDESELTMYAWSKSAMKECSLSDKPTVYRTEKTGLWGEPVRQRRTVITNDYAAPNPLKKGYPPGHIPVVRHMGVPVIEDGHVVLVAGVANKSSDYTEEDARALLLLMQGLWQVLKRRRAEEALIENEARFRSIFENSPYPIVLNDRKTRKYIAVNEAFLTENGYSREEVLGKDSLELGLVPPQDQALIVNLLQTKNRADRIPVTIHRRDGTVSHILISAIPVTFHNEPAILTMTADITELEQTRETLKIRYDELQAVQEDLQAKARQLEEIASTVPGVVYQYYVKKDGKGGFSYVNVTSGREIFGAGESIPDFLEWFTDHVHPQDRARFMESHHAAITGKNPWHFEGRFIRPSGDTIWFSGSSCPVAHGDEIVFTGILMDITKQKADEEQLKEAYEKISISEEELREQYDALNRSGEAIREREEKYRQLVEVTGTGYVILDKDGGVLDANREYARITGYSDRTDLIGRNVLEWTAENDRQRNTEAVQKCLSDGKILGLEITYTDLSGRIIPVEINAAVVREGGKTRIIALTRDISSRKAAEQAFRASENRYRTLVENSHDIIFTLDPESTITFVSPSITALLGYAPQDIVGRAYRSIVHPDDLEECEAYIRNSLKKSDPRTDVEFRIFRADGSIGILAANISPVTDDQGNLLFFVGAARDITDLKRSRMAIQESSKKLGLLNNITRHDVANQLTTLLGFTQLAMMTKPSPEVRDFLVKIEKSAQVIQRQIDFTRTYQELGVSAPTWQKIGDLVRNAEQKELPVTCTCTQYEVYADPMLSKVFFNLFDNAIRHGEHATQVTVRCEPVSDELVIYIEDNGAGIPLDEKPKLFRKGYGKNTGFGLFLAREILAITGISIHETGQHGKGARFEIAVPKGVFRPLP